MKREETLKELNGIVDLSGLHTDKRWELANPYWPDAYPDMIANSPWLLVRTPIGMVKLGWRKRVISIDWSDTKIRKYVTTDETTNEKSGVHAWSVAKAVEYLTKLASFVKEEV